MLDPVDITAACDSIIRNHRFMMSHDLPGIIMGSELFPNPRYPPATLAAVVSAVSDILASEPMLMYCNEPVIVVGDIHGHLLDLHRILLNFGYPPAQRYLFLGDFVDRGAFSTECITLIYALKYLYPSHVLLIRGNHEFAVTGGDGGFGDELEGIYPGCRMFTRFCESFANMPLAVVLFERIFCCHGGPFPELMNISQLNDIPRPLNDFENPLVNGLVWSDPTLTISDYGPSHRGTGWFFGRDAVAEFLATNNVDVIVRGHQVVEKGFESLWDGSVMTVFSASNYCGRRMNCGAVAVIRSAKVIKPVEMSPLAFVRRAASRPCDPLVVTDEMLSNLTVPAVLRVKSLVVGRFVDSNSQGCTKLDIGEKLRGLTKRRTRVTDDGQPVQFVALAG